MVLNRKEFQRRNLITWAYRIKLFTSKVTPSSFPLQKTFPLLLIVIFLLINQYWMLEDLNSSLTLRRHVPNAKMETLDIFTIPFWFTTKVMRQGGQRKLSLMVWAHELNLFCCYLVLLFNCCVLYTVVNKLDRGKENWKT